LHNNKTIVSENKTMEYYNLNNNFEIDLSYWIFNFFSNIFINSPFDNEGTLTVFFETSFKSLFKLFKFSINLSFDKIIDFKK
jgi:hypothetical protein